ncbi:hypothetical protein TWF718_008426 [Orbilia javanica]|uniref:Nucleoside phosphorylase domain-containing protein n=1 Tax=Orbilia javanica TaxID=47235 RepID=A0AAN8RMV7_9PEZI
MSTRTITRTHEDYTVGWICALKEELVAAKVMLDETHPQLSQSHKDSNRYTLGSIGNHNIVIACLPSAGTNQAATVATSMANTFQNLKVGLLVGIGGGIPRRVDLGDVVVGYPTGKFPGVVQHDFGQWRDGEKPTFVRRGALNKPPTALLTALQDQRADHELYGFDFDQSLERVRERYPRLSARYTSRPMPVKTHKSEASYRTARTSQSQSSSSSSQVGVGDTPKIHFGLIASGNQVIKSASYRDSLNEKLGNQVFCVEMEAAGLVDDFPCLVIRGISDHADGNKGDDWHEYAAMVAAVYAKDFLGYTRAVDVQRETSISEVLRQQGQMMKQLLEDKTKSRLAQQNDKILKFLEGMTPIDHGLQHDSISRSRHPGTGEWIIDSRGYQNWLNQDKGILHCLGVPGAGKTFLISKVIDHLLGRYSISAGSSGKAAAGGRPVGVAHIYFDYNRAEDQKPSDILASLLLQLVHQHQDFALAKAKSSGEEEQYTLPKAVQQLCEQTQRPRIRPGTEEIVRTLEATLEAFSRVFFIIDAVDECGDYTQDFLHYMFRLRSRQGVKLSIFATSRDIQNIVNRFEFEGGRVLELRAREEDLREYLRSVVFMSERGLLIKNLELIQSKIIKAADGIFLLARLHFQLIEYKVTQADLKEALDSLHKGERAYSDAYERFIVRIRAQHKDFKDLAYQILDWVICAKRPLLMIELQCALAAGRPIADKPSPYTPTETKIIISSDQFTDSGTIISVCKGLVTFDKATGLVRLIHYTARQHFNQKWDIKGAHTYIANSCMRYVIYRLREIEAAEASNYEPNPKAVDMLDVYAALFWVSHSDEAWGDDVGPKRRGFINSDIVQSLGDRGTSTKNELTICSVPFSIMKRFGFDDLVEKFLGDNIISHYVFGAVKLGDTALIQLFIDYNMSIAFRDSEGRTPLILATECGKIPMMKILIRAGANVNSRDRLGETALFKAVKANNDVAISLLKAKGADTKIKNAKGRTVMWYQTGGVRRGIGMVLLLGSAHLATVALDRLMEDTSE